MNEKLLSGLEKSRKLLGLHSGMQPLDAFVSLLEERLLMADCGPQATGHAIAQVRAQFEGGGSAVSGAEVKRFLRELVRDMVANLERPLEVSGARPFVLMVAGVNGGGKTTTIAKLAHMYASQNLRVLISTSDTFRAAAREQTLAWAERLGDRVGFADIAAGNPSAVAFDAVKAAGARGSDLLILDTAGRLPSQAHLMQELAKIGATVGKAQPGAPHEVLLVLDATNGRNALAQLKAFDEAAGVTGIAMTKLDGTAKGGTLLAIAAEYPKPVRYVGVGEGMEDLLPFEAGVFAAALLAAT